MNIYNILVIKESYIFQKLFPISKKLVGTF